MGTTVSRRMFSVKVKRKRALREPRESVREPRVSLRDDDKWIGEPVRHSVSLRAGARSVPDVPEEWWKDWRMLTLATSLILAVAVGLYFLAQLKSPPRYAAAEKTRAAHAAAAVPGAGPSRYGAGNTSGDNGIPRTRGPDSYARRPLPTDESFINTFGGRNAQGPHMEPSEGSGGRGAMVLPSDARGNCDIGPKDIRNLSECLALHGARARAMLP